MTVTMSKGEYGHILISCKRKQFREKYKIDTIPVLPQSIYKTLSSMASWANNELNEEFLIEMD